MTRQEMDKVMQVPAVPGRLVDGHKGTFGTVVVIGGSSTMLGAAGLCGRAAFKVGVGLVKMMARREILPWLLMMEPCATGVELSEGLEEGQLMRLLDEVDGGCRAVLAVGPGMGRGSVSGMVVREVMRQSRAVVLDADGLNMLAEMGTTCGRLRAGGGKEKVIGPEVVLTPHAGEFARLAVAVGVEPEPREENAKMEAAGELARKHGAVVVYKGHRTVVTDGKQGYVNTTGNAALATGGSGDVLTGCIAGLMAQGMSGFEAAVLGVYLHGEAGDLWAKEYGPSGARAVDVAELLPKAVQKHRMKA